MEHLFLFEDFKSKKKLLYLHGLGAKPRQARIDIMNVFVSALTPLFHYEEKPSWDAIVEIMNIHKPDAVGGSSLGGYLAFHVSNLYKVPGLLFNPALGETTSDGVEISKRQPVPNDVKTLPLYVRKMAVVGMKDDVVDPKMQLEKLKGIERIIKDKDMGHGVPDDKFKNYFSEFYENFLAV